MIEDITDKLFSVPPQNTLYHYTSLSGLLGIVGSRELRASDIRYMNDSSELRHALTILRGHITRRITEGCDNPTLFNELLEWLSHRIVSGPMVYGASFRANGNLLSQWRGYSTNGKGVSLGFDPADIQKSAARQQFQVGQCIYDADEQAALMERLVTSLESRAAALPLHEPRDGGGNSWLGLFEQIEGDLLRIAALLKHPSFEEEQEWRIVSPVHGSGASQRIRFREGNSMLVPYFAFELSPSEEQPMALEHVYLGPTNHIDLSMNAVERYLAQESVTPRRGVTYCDIPYRQR